MVSLRSGWKWINRKKRFSQKNTINSSAKYIDRFSPSWVYKQISEETIPIYQFQATNPERWKRDAKKALRELVGWLDPPRTINSEIMWKASDALGTYEKRIIDGELESKLPLYVCRPRRERNSGAWIICLQGHTSGMHNSIGCDPEELFRVDPPGDRNLVKWCFENGFSALCLEQRSLGERVERLQVKQSSHPCQDAAMRALLFGRTLMGERLLDIRISLQFLLEAGFLHSHQTSVGVLGNSLGGTVALYANSLIDEIDFAIAGSCVSSIDHSIAKIYHCTDLYIPALRKFFEFGDLVGLAAPKPLVIVQGEKDTIFPLEGMRRATAEIAKIYEAFHASDNLIVKTAPGGHQFYSSLATEALREIEGRVF